MLVVYALDTPGAEFRENSRERGARSPAYRSQRFDPPPGAQTFAEQSGKVYRGAGRVEGRVGSLGRGRSARDGAVHPGAGRSGALRAGLLGAGGKRRRLVGGRAVGAATGPRGGSGGAFAAAGETGQAGSQGQRGGNFGRQPGFPGGSKPSEGGLRAKTPEKPRVGAKNGAERHRQGPFSARAGRGGRRFGKNTVIRRRKKLHKPRNVITDPGAGAGSRPRTRYISRPFSGRFSLSDKSYFSPE